MDEINVYLFLMENIDHSIDMLTKVIMLAWYIFPFRRFSNKGDISPEGLLIEFWIIQWRLKNIDFSQG